ncbi:MAG: hypothetical protein DI534_02560 [Leifsonia xyli]|nr:MAG: hypothetical protein DI534_02560 [Leifsonia xyli]
MPTESELRSLFQGGEAPDPLDADRIIRRARARRRPKRIAVAALGGLAAVAVVVPVALALGSTGPTGTSQLADAPAADGQQERMADQAAGGSLATDPYPECRLASGVTSDAVPSGAELQLSQPTPGGALELTLVNGSGTALLGSIETAPYVALGTGEVPLGWSAGATETTRVDLAPGGTLTLSVPLQTTACAGGNLPAGDYGAEAELTIRLDDGQLVTANSIRTEITVGSAE